MLLLASVNVTNLIAKRSELVTKLIVKLSVKHVIVYLTYAVFVTRHCTANDFLVLKPSNPVIAQKYTCLAFFFFYWEGYLFPLYPFFFRRPNVSP